VLVLDPADATKTRRWIERMARPGKTSRADLHPAWTRRIDSPTADQWPNFVDQAMELFAHEVLEKIVLARRVTLEFPHLIDPWSLLLRLAHEAQRSYVFGLQTSATSMFMGATPERLFSRTGRRLESEVVAGTRRRGATAPEDAQLGQELLASQKDQLEHDIVRKSIRQRLHGCVDQLTVDAHATLLPLANKQHLYSRVAGQLRAEIRDEDLLERLHPTPAVGGYPTENALAEIKRLEPFERGWYAAPVGWLSHDASEFIVAIRSALVQPRRMHLFSGAGIVPGSTALSEWDEIESKISDFLQLVSPAMPAEA
jgi:menaquinone-specific isochorismate synthase